MSCSHPYTVRDASGFIVCTECAVVVDRDVFETSVPAGTSRRIRQSKYIQRIRRMGAELSLPDRVMEYAGTILDEIPRVTDPHIAAALYASCFQYGIPRTEKELSSILHIPLKTLARHTSKLRRAGHIPAETLDASTTFARFLPGHVDAHRARTLATEKYNEMRHIHANVSVDTLVSRCVRDTCLELNTSDGNDKPRRSDGIHRHLD